MKASIGLGFERTRALCVAAMVIFHSLVWLSPYERWLGERHEGYYAWISLGFMLGVFALMLPACAGFSLRVFLERNSSSPRRSRKVISLCAVLLLAHVLMQWLTWGKSTILTWEALPFIALSYGITYLLFILGGDVAVAIFTLVSLLGTPPLRNLFSENSWFREILVSNQNPSGVWPLFPWYFLVGSGFIAAHRLQKIKIQKVGLLLSLLTILIFLLLGNGMSELGTFALWGSHPFQTSPLNVAALGSGFVGLVLCFASFARISTKADRDFILPLGRSVLPIYLSHVILGVLLSQDWQQTDARVAVLTLGPLFLLAGCWAIGFLFQKLVSLRLTITFSRKVAPHDA